MSCYSCAVWLHPTTLRWTRQRSQRWLWQWYSNREYGSCEGLPWFRQYGVWTCSFIRRFYIERMHNTNCFHLCSQSRLCNCSSDSHEEIDLLFDEDNPTDNYSLGISLWNSCFRKLWEATEKHKRNCEHRCMCFTYRLTNHRVHTSITFTFKLGTKYYHPAIQQRRLCHFPSHLPPAPKLERWTQLHQIFVSLQIHSPLTIAETLNYTLHATTINQYYKSLWGFKQAIHSPIRTYIPFHNVVRAQVAKESSPCTPINEFIIGLLRWHLAHERHRPLLDEQYGHAFCSHSMKQGPKNVSSIRLDCNATIISISMKMGIN